MRKQVFYILRVHSRSYTRPTKDKPQVLPSAHFADTTYQILVSWSLQTAPQYPASPTTSPKKEAAEAWGKHRSHDLLQHIVSNTKGGTGKCGLMGQGPKGEAGTLVLRDQKPWARDQLPLLYWTFQKTTEGGQVHSGPFQCQTVTR